MQCPECGHDDAPCAPLPILPPQAAWLETLGPVYAVAPVDGGYVVEAAEQRVRIAIDHAGVSLEPLPWHP